MRQREWGVKIFITSGYTPAPTKHTPLIAQQHIPLYFEVDIKVVAKDLFIHSFNGGSLASRPARVSMLPSEHQRLMHQFEAMKATLRMCGAKIKKFEEEKVEAARKKTNNKIRWGKRYIMTIYPAAQKVVNLFARLYWNDGNVFLCTGFHR